MANFKSSFRWWALSVLPMLCAGMMTGCGLLPGQGIIDGNVDPALRSPDGPTRGEPNDDFDSAVVAVFDGARIAQLQGMIGNPDDVDVYRIGSLISGDRLIINVETPSDNMSLDAMIIAFDDEQRIFIDNDDAAGSLDPTIDEIVRHDGDPYFVAIGASSLAQTSRDIGSYRMTVTVVPDGEVPPPQRQVILIDFDGDEFGSPAIGVSSVPPFDTGAISPLYSGLTDQVKEIVVERVKDDFAMFDIDIVSTDETDRPADVFSPVLVGGFHPPGLPAFGAAVSVDHYNQSQDDVAVIFAEVFTPDVFRTIPDVNELAVAIANVTSHEIGHLLGLNHVNDPCVLMDAVSPADVLLMDQEFGVAPLFEAEFFDIGFQDSRLLLAEILGVL